MMVFLAIVFIWGGLGAWLASGWLCAGTGLRWRLGVGVVLLAWATAFAWTMLWQLRTGNRLPRPVDFALSLSLPWFVWMPCVFGLLEVLRLLRLAPAGMPGRRIFGLCTLGLLVLLTAYGMWNASRPRVTVHALFMDKLKGPLDVVVVSDLHLGSPSARLGFIRAAAEQVEALRPDLVLMPGDILDWAPAPLADEALMAQVGRFRGRYGTFACEGNHDVYAGALQDVVRRLAQLGIDLLRDEAKTVETPAGPVVIAGRSWPREERHFAGRNVGGRPSVAALFASVPDEALRVVLDHSPMFYKEALDEADLQVSGHTHNGQFFPASLAAQLLFDNAWGVLRTNRLTQVTTCGLSTWSAPVRLPSYPEIMLLRLTPAGAGTPAE